MHNLYRVLLVGENYRLKGSAENDSIGFFLTVYVSAQGEQEARVKALERVKTDNRLAQFEESIQGSSRIVVDEIELSEESESQETGISYFPMTGE